MPDSIEGRVDWLGCCLGGDRAAERQVVRHRRRAGWYDEPLAAPQGCVQRSRKVRSPDELWIEGEEVAGE